MKLLLFLNKLKDVNIIHDREGGEGIQSGKLVTALFRRWVLTSLIAHLDHTNPSIYRLPLSFTADGDINYEDQKIIHVEAPTNPTDVPNKSYKNGRVVTFATTCDKKIFHWVVSLEENL